MKKTCLFALFLFLWTPATLRGQARARFSHGFTAIQIPEGARFAGGTGTLVEITHVSERSGAGAAGMVAGDIVREVNGRPVRTLYDLEKVLRGPRPPKGEFVFSVFREGRRIRLVLSPEREAVGHFGEPGVLPPVLVARKRTRISAFLPLVSQTSTKNSNRSQIGAGVEVSYRINRRLSLNGGLFGFREGSGDPNFWGTLHGGIDLEFLKTRVFHLFLRPAVSLAYIRERGDRYDYDSVGLGASLFSGFLFQVTREVDLGFLFAVSYVALRDEAVGVSTTREEDSFAPLYGGVFLRIVI